MFAAGFVSQNYPYRAAVPATGARLAEGIDAPIMAGISVIVAAFVGRRLSVPGRVSERLGFGVLALRLMLASEFTFVLRLRGLSFRDYVTNLDPVAGSAYYIALVSFAAMPLLVARR